MVALSAYQSAYAPLVAVIGAALLMRGLADRDATLHRSVILALGVALGLRYLHWRATETIAPFGLSFDCLVTWSFLALEVTNYASFLSVSLMMTRTRNRSAEADANVAWWAPAPPPRVVVLIATYNEEAEVLERTLAGAAALDYPNLEIWLCDDGRRDWLAAFAARFGARHVTRPDNAHAKAGNINHALALLAERDDPPDFVAILDADFVPHVTFVSRAIALFHADDVALVQTPQHFFNPDPVQHNLGLRRSYPDDQRLFFHQLMPARDAWDIAFCCGTSSIARFDRLQAIGLFPTDSVTEDFLLSLALREKGWRTVFLDEPLTEGLAPEGVKEYMTQRARWCLGQMQIVRGRFGPLSRRRIRLRDRWSVIDAFLNWTASYTFRIGAFVFPLLYWYFEILVVNATVTDVISYFVPYLVFTLVAFNFLSRGLVLPIVYDVNQTLAAFPIVRAAYTGLLKPHGHPFKVTAKGGDRSRTIVQWGLMRPFIVLFTLTAIGLVAGLLSWRFDYSDAGDGKVVTLFWTTWNLLVLALTMLACVELPRSGRTFARPPERVTIRPEGGAASRVWTSGLGLENVRLRGVEVPKGEKVTITIENVGEVSGRVIACDPGNTIVRLGMDEATRTALIQSIHASGGAPNVSRPRVFGMLGDLMIRLATGRA